jgi:chromosome segregation ATPase
MNDSMLETLLRQIQASLHDLTNEVGEVKLGIAHLNERMTALDTRMDNADVRGSHIEERVLRLERHLGVRS